MISMTSSNPGAFAALSMLFGTSTAFVTMPPPLGPKGPPAHSLVGSARPISELRGTSVPTLPAAHAAIGFLASAFVLTWAARSGRKPKALSMRTADQRCVARGAKPKYWGRVGTQELMVNEDCITAPLGEPGKYYWDPLNLAEEITPEKRRQYRTAEIKHGRVAMLAVLGDLAQQRIRFPGEIFKEAPTGFKALDFGLSDEAFRISLLLLFVIAGYLETQLSDEGRAPGDFG
mmetsp:Transcript_76337/g.163719  ORF Transcript_76337/g.163719 Transcript_76337/m.163719 type:complete len:232 (-) Transcript_76337:435-1130(-)